MVFDEGNQRLKIEGNIHYIIRKLIERISRNDASFHARTDHTRSHMI